MTSVTGKLIRHRGVWWHRSPTGSIARLADTAVRNNALTPGALRTLLLEGHYSVPSLDDYNATIAPVTSCNLTCPYCTQNIAAAKHEGARPSRIPARVIGEDVLERTTGFIKSSMDRRAKTQLNLVLFGGEPLLRPDKCIAILDQLADVSLRSCVVITNGTALTAKVVENLMAKGLSAAQVSLDGGAESHDATRRGTSGQGTYRRIIGNIQAACRQGLKLHLRINVTAANQNRLCDPLYDLSALRSPSLVAVTLALIEDTGVGFKHASTCSRETFEALLTAYQTAIAAGFTVEWPTDLSCVFCDYKPGERGVVIGPDGGLFSCWDAVGRDQLKIGDVWSGFDMDAVADSWKCCGYSAAEPEILRRALLAEVDEAVFRLLVDRLSSKSDSNCSHVSVGSAAIADS